MTDTPMPDAPMLARVHVLLADALARLDPADRAERIAYCQAHDQHGIRMHPPTDDALIEFTWGGRTLAIVDRAVLLDDGPIHVEHIADLPDTLEGLTDD